jgi:hypothetical protein
MAESRDVYSDQFQTTVNPYGATLNFMATSAEPPPPGSPVRAERVATIRMSLEHLKVVAFMLRRQIVQYEQQSGVRIQVPADVLNGLRIGREDWDEFWRPASGA